MAKEDLEESADGLNLPDGHIDVVQCINRQFPDEASLTSGVDAYMTKIRAKIAAIDNELADLVRVHSAGEAQAEMHVVASIDAVHALSTRLDALKEAARAACEVTERSIAPAKPYYVAISNVRSTEDALEALVALAEGTDKLELAAQAASLDLVARDPGLFERINNSLALFAELQHGGQPLKGPGVKHVPVLRVRVKRATELLRQAINSEFRLLSETVTRSVASTGSKPTEAEADAVSRLQVACNVANGIGEDTRAEVTGGYIRGRMAAYRNGFDSDTDRLGSIERRTGWLRRELRSNWASLGGELLDRGWGAVFPPSWDVPWKLSFAMMDDIRGWLSTTLDSDAETDVVGLVAALSHAKEFEIELDRRFRRYETTASAESAGRTAGESRSFAGYISKCFSPHMGAYVTQEDESLAITFRSLLAKETWTAVDDEVLKSATELFLAIKKSMHTCAALDVQQSMFSLYKVFQKHLAAYATELVRRVPAVGDEVQAKVATTKEDPAPGRPSLARRIDVACSLITTAEYCSVTVDQLEKLLRETIDEAFAEAVVLEKERDRFVTISASAARSLVANVQFELVVSLSALAETDWSKWEDVGDASDCIADVQRKLAATVPALSAKMNRPHVRFFLERLAASVLPDYVDILYACEAVNSTAAQQLLLDTASLKDHMLRAPALANMPAPPTYAKLVEREIGKGEAMLKVVLTPVDKCVETYQSLIPGGSAGDLQRILEIKGLQRAQAAPLVLEYSRSASPEQGLLQNAVPRGTRFTGGSGHVRAKSHSAVLGVGGIAGEGQANASVRRTNLSTDSINLNGTSQPSESGAGANQGVTAAEAGVESMRALFRGLGHSWGSLNQAGIADRLGQTADRINESFGSTTELVKKRFTKPQGQ